MKAKIRLIVLGILILSSFFATTSVLAQDESWIRLSTDRVDVKVGKEFTVDVLIESAPKVYGVDVQLVYDPAVLEVVDMDGEADGIQIAPGDFLDQEQSYPLQNQVDNQTGTIDYAATLLNPAPEAEGDGVLCQVTFRAIADGSVELSLSEGSFGTTEGETVYPRFEGDTITISEEERSAPDAGGADVSNVESVEQSSESPDNSPGLLERQVSIKTILVAGVISVIAVALIAILVFGVVMPRIKRQT